ncbi:MAG: hypothetical protein KC478_04915 [Bacteriovoracaceae bacterium]|nr:hypothetical protein [Bacteriovoracaceae bacterium]
MRITKLFSPILLSLTFSAQAQSPNPRADWTESDYWEHTQLNFKQSVYGILNQRSCTSRAQNFVGCVATVNKIERIQNPDKKTLVKYDFANRKFINEDLSDLTAKEFRTQYQQYLRDLKAEINQMGRGLRLVNLEVQDRVKKLEQTIITEDNDSMFGGRLINEYLKVAVDPHTYLVPKLLIEDDSQSSEVHKALGILFATEEFDGVKRFFVRDMTQDSPAVKAGLKLGDIIISVNGLSEITDAYDQMKNSDVVDLEIQRNEAHFNIVVEKDIITYKNVNSKVIMHNGINYGVIKLNSFMDPNGCKAIENKAQEMLTLFMIEGLILDLRNNGGGRIDQAVCINQLFLEPGSIVWSERRLVWGEKIVAQQTSDAHRNQIFKDLHTVTLINANSASASEAVAMHLKDYEKSFIIGERSYGKGSAQTVRQLKTDRRILKGQTEAIYYGPKGITPQTRGVTPDIVAYPRANNTEATEATRESDQYAFPIPVKNINPSDFITESRKKDINDVKRCLNQSSLKVRYEKLSPVKQLLFDNQLETGLEVLECANSLNIPIKRDLKLNKVPLFRYHIQSVW